MRARKWLCAVLLACSTIGVGDRVLLNIDEPTETTKTIELTSQALTVKPMTRYEIAFSAKTDSSQTIERNSRLRLGDLSRASSQARLDFYDVDNKRIGEIHVPILSEAFHDYNSEFYAPLKTESARLFLSGCDEKDSVVLTNCQLKEVENSPEVNVHSVFDHGLLNSYGYSGGTLHQRPGDGKIVWNSLGSGFTPVFPVRENAFYKIHCKGEFYRSRIHRMDIFDENGKWVTRLSHPLKVTPDGGSVSIKMPETSRYARFWFCNCVVEELTVTPEHGKGNEK